MKFIVVLVFFTMQDGHGGSQRHEYQMPSMPACLEAAKSFKVARVAARDHDDYALAGVFCATKPVRGR